MEHLPTELVIQILSYMSREELKVTGFLSFEYQSLVLPLLFCRIRPWLWGAREQGTAVLNIMPPKQLPSLLRRQNARCESHKEFPTPGRGVPTNNGDHSMVGGIDPTWK